MLDANLAPTVESDKDALDKGQTGVGLWVRKVKHARDLEKSWREDDAKKAVEMYEAGENSRSVFNIHHSNIETIVPALYNSTPIPDVSRRYYDTDPVSRLGAELIERTISCALDKMDFDEVMTGVVQDAALPGRGNARVRYEGKHETVTGPDGQPIVDPQTGAPFERIVNQRTWVEPCVWDRWGHGPAYTWEQVPFVYFLHDLTKDHLKALGVDDKIVDECGFGKHDEQKTDDDKESVSGVYKTIPVIEIWDRGTKRVIWFTERYTTAPLLAVDDPLKLTGFFPVPKSLRYIIRTNRLTPTTPAKIYMPLLDELDEVTRRIKRLVKQLRVRGAVDPAMKDIVSRLESADDGEYVTSDQSTTAFSGGKLTDAIVHWPMEPTVAAINQLLQQRELVKQSIFEVSGVSDILRGATNPNETLGAQQIKAQWGNQRVQKLQKEVQRFANDLFRMIAEVYLNLYEWDTLKAITRMQFTPQEAAKKAPPNPMGHNGGPPLDDQQPQQDYEQAVRELLNSDERPYAIRIKTNSTIRADMSRNQEQMNLFLQGTSQFVQALSALPQAGLGPYVKPMTKVWSSTFARQFNLGKEAEDALESVTEAEVMGQEEDPRIAEAQAQMQQMQQMIQQLEAQLADKNADREAKASEAAAKLQHEAGEKDKDRALQAEFKAAEMSFRDRELGLKERQSEVGEVVQLAGIEGQAAERDIKRQAVTARTNGIIQ